jgi:magnesium-protoporphyrin O-methyltransferase
VVAIDLSPTLVDLARDRLPADLGPGRVDFRSGDMLAPGLGLFDHVVAMDSLIHYAAADAVRALATLAERTRRSMLFTFAPRTPALAAMHAVGRLFPRGDRAPAIEPVAEAQLRRLMVGQEGLERWQPARTQRIASGFYTSQAFEWLQH